MSCPCDIVQHPLPLRIAPGLTRLPRQIAGFPQFRRAMLHAVGSAQHAAALSAWSATSGSDLGVMLIEAWAYLADVLAFYDEVHAHECYLRTARREPSVRELVARLGYRPKPAIAASVELALLADGRKPISVPAGAAFRSAAFGDEAPQVFELTAAQAIHPLRSRLRVDHPRPATVDATGGPGLLASTLRLDRARSARFAAGDFLLVQPEAADPDTWVPARVSAFEPATDAFGARLSDLTLDREVAFAPGLALDGVRVLRPTRSAGLWVQTATTMPPVVSETLSLDGVHRDLRVGDLLLVVCGDASPAEMRWFRVTNLAEPTADVVVADTPEGTTTAKLPYTEITLDAAIDVEGHGASAEWGAGQRAEMTVYYGLRDAGRLAAPQQPILGPGDPIRLVAAPRPWEDTEATRFVLQDADGVAAAGNGAIDFDAALLLPASFDAPRPALTLPVALYANVITATRGESIAREVLGSGDAASANQSFTLSKRPLTYLSSATASTGFASTLRVWVDGREWREVTSFFTAAPEDSVFTVALDADGGATLTFGDGQHGARLPTGQDNVVAAYRHGAGLAAPPAGSIAQIARGVAGLAAVVQPRAASSGADAESADFARSAAPRQALTLGRAVSILDMEAFAAECAGVRAVAVGWAWDKKAQRPVVQVWVVGDAAEVAPAVLARLQAVSHPTTPIAVVAAIPVSVALDLAVTVATDRVGSDVRDAVAAALLAPGTGLLSIEQLGIGRAFYFSRLMAAIHAVPGVLAVSMAWTRAGGPATAYADTPGQGAHFSFADGITIDGKAYANG